MEVGEVLNCLVSACAPEAMPPNWFLFWAYVSLSVRMLIGGAIFYAILWQDIPTVVSLSGGAIVVGTGYSLKAVIGHERQFPDCGLGHAMPSMHALLAGYFATYYAICFWRYSDWGWARLIYRMTVVGAYATLVCVSRVQLRAGDAMEVFVGVLLGSASAMAMLHFLMYALQTALPGNIKQD